MPPRPHASMRLAPPIAVLRRTLRRSPLLQVGLILGFWLLGELLSRLLHLPFPGSIVGLFVLLALLSSGSVSVLDVRRGAGSFLSEMLLFFVPAVLAIVEHREFLGWLGLKLLVAVVLGTLTVMIVTGLAVDLCYRLISRRIDAHGAGHDG